MSSESVLDRQEEASLRVVNFKHDMPDGTSPTDERTAVEHHVMGERFSAFAFCVDDNHRRAALLSQGGDEHQYDADFVVTVGVGSATQKREPIGSFASSVQSGSRAG